MSPVGQVVEEEYSGRRRFDSLGREAEEVRVSEVLVPGPRSPPVLALSDGRSVPVIAGHRGLFGPVSFHWEAQQLHGI